MLLNLGDWVNLGLVLLEEVFREVSEAGVLRARQQLVLSDSPGLTTGHSEHLLEMVLNNHGGTMVDLGHNGRSSIHAL